MNEKKIPIFVHIPKTAGSTVRSILRKQYDENEICFGNNEEVTSRLQTMCEKDLEKIKCFHGHFHYGIHQYLSNKPYVYYTMLRDPIEHVISEYFYVLRKPNNFAYEKVKDMSFEEFICTEEFKDRTSNRQTFFISGGQENNLFLAKENLEKFSIIGITEMFDESLFLIGKELGWKDISYRKKNVTKKRPQIDEFPKHVKEIIEENNQFDMELYRYAKELLEKRIEGLGSKEKNELRQYLLSQRARNRKYE